MGLYTTNKKKIYKTMEKHFSMMDDAEVELSTQHEDETSTPAGGLKQLFGAGWFMLLICGALLLSVWMLADLGDGRFGYASVLILLLCPLMHLFMHRGHHGH